MENSLLTHWNSLSSIDVNITNFALKNNEKAVLDNILTRFEERTPVNSRIYLSMEENNHSFVGSLNVKSQTDDFKSQGQYASKDQLLKQLIQDVSEQILHWKKKRKF